MDITNVPNAKHWEPNSIVVVKEDYTAGDAAWVANQFLLIDATSSAVTSRHQDIFLLKRMVQPGSVVSVKRANGRIKTVNLPAQVEDLLEVDMTYIAEQIRKLSEPMSEAAQQDFLPAANGSTPDSSTMTSMSLASS